MAVGYVAMIDAALADDRADTEWRPISELNPTGTTYINVRTVAVTTYRWKPYKPDGARQMGAKGRWQRARDPDGWENARLPPDGEWVPNPAKPPP
jgi:hypothetical protein